VYIRGKKLLETQNVNYEFPVMPDYVHE
jgi:hypothetical protein